jgi:BolA protein
MMIVSARMIEDRLASQLKPAHLEVIDESADHAGHAGANGLGQGTHFRVRIGDPSFNQLTRINRHRLVYDAVQDLMNQGIHALAVEVVSCE